MQAPDETEAPSDDKTARREAIQIWVLAVVIALAGIIAALQWVGAAPPKAIVLATGPADGAYASLAARIVDGIDDSELEIRLLPTRGSAENRELLDKGEVDLAFVQGGILDPGKSTSVEAIASLGVEPVWIFSRDVTTTLETFRGKRISVGQIGSGTRPVATHMLELAGITANDAVFLDLEPRAAVTAIRRGECDAVFLVSNARASNINTLMRSRDAGVVPVSLERAHAYTRHARFLREARLSPGMFDIDDSLPPEALRLVATTTALVARRGFHDSLPPLLLDAARRQLRTGGLFEDEGEFPSSKDLEIPLSEAANRWFESGRSWLYRILPFRLAALVDRLKILILPLLTLLLPLIRFAPPVYRWRVRRRIFRWYAVVLDLEADLRESQNSETIETAIERLGRLQREITGIRVPLSYAEELYNLRMHLRQVREDLLRRRREMRAADSAADSDADSDAGSDEGSNAVPLGQ